MIHRFKLCAVSDEELKAYTKHGATIAAATLVLVDVDLADDSDLEDLIAFMVSAGYAFVETKPSTHIP